jgi:hypothetical protein
MVSSRLFWVFFSVTLSASIPAVAVTVNFDPSTPATGPFPTDYLTMPDATQKTGVRINLPMPDCGSLPNDCLQAAALNELDGFHLQPTVNVSFSDAVDPTTLKAGILIVWLDNLTTDEPGQGDPGKITAVNQITYDPAANVARARANDLLDQHRHYAILVTDAVKDTSGTPVTADPNFTACIQAPANDYCNLLAQIVGTYGSAAGSQNIVAASVFTTLSATTWLEQARDLLPQMPVGFHAVGSAVKAANVTVATLKAQVGVNPDKFQSFPQTIPSGVFDGVDRLVFGTYQSPNFLNAQQYIPNLPTATALALPGANNTVTFHAFIPSSAAPSAGYPVIIFGHGFGENALESPTLVASTFGKAGFVTLAINAVGHGYGPQTLLQLTVKGASGTTDFVAGGRGIDLNGDGAITTNEGCFIGWPYPAGLRDCLRQTVVDLMQLVQLVRSGTAIEGPGGVKLDGSRIYYAGVSLGAIYGSMLTAVDPNVRAAGLSSGGGSIVDISRWTQAGDLRAFAKDLLGNHVPSLLNNGADFNDNFVLRDQPAKVNTVDGAPAIQDFFNTLDWLSAPGDPLSYTPHLNTTPLANVPAKKVLFQFPLGDRTVPNPEESAFIRGAGLLSSTTEFRNDTATTLARTLGQTLPSDPHAFLVNLTTPVTGAIAVAAQQQFAQYLSSDGKTIPDANALLNALIRQLLPLPITVNGVFQTPTAYVEALNF